MSQNEQVSIGTAFNLQRKFERLHISKTSQSSYQDNSSSDFPRLGKRTFRELERWDFDFDEQPSPKNMHKSMADFNQDNFSI